MTCIALSCTPHLRHAYFNPPTLFKTREAFRTVGCRLMLGQSFTLTVQSYRYESLSTAQRETDQPLTLTSHHAERKPNVGLFLKM
ncbi:hypothetical protein QQF64_000562 [Cirrhinus molitorella]|uniref:Uncharacterized protein n=1 Tax=Cirrhinus molitorella TaxID=172907 RepID=A0ABR3NXI0_9TELE